MPRLKRRRSAMRPFHAQRRAVEGEAEPRMLLTDFLRHELGATGTHVGCEHGVCGACTIQIDGVPARACLTLAVQADGASIRTVEGLAPAPGRLVVLQEAFRRHHALQCGFCTAGILMSLDDYLAQRARPDRGRDPRLPQRPYLPLHRLHTDRRRRRSKPPPNSLSQRRRPMLDLGTSFIASVARDPDAIAIVDGDLRLTYARMVRRDLRAGRRPSTRSASSPAIMSSPCCKTAGRRRRCTGPASSPASSSRRSTGAPRPTRSITASRTPKPARSSIEDVSAEAVHGSAVAQAAARIASIPAHGGDRQLCRLLIKGSAPDAEPRVGADAWSVMLYTSGTTSRPKGVPRRHRAERAAALAHVAQNLYGRGERTLGVMPLYHTMGVRSLLAMSLIGGTFVCLPRFDAASALALIDAEKITNLYLVPTLYHDLVHHAAFARDRRLSACASSALPAPR